MMNTVKISGGYSVLAQILAIAVNVLILISLAIIGLEDGPVKTGEAIFILCIILFCFVFIKNSLDFYDIFIVKNSHIAINNIFNKININSSDIENIQSGVLPFVYYIQTHKRRYYFFLNIKLILYEITTIQSVDILALLRKELCSIKHEK